MKVYRRILKTIVPALLMSAAYLAAVLYTSRLKECEQFALILPEQGALSFADVAAMRKLEEQQEQRREFAVWAQENGVPVQNEDLGRACDVSQVIVCGRTDLVLRASSRLEMGDTGGCLLDRETALRLFGSTDVAGQTLLVNGEKKTVRGLLMDVSGTVVTEAASDAENLRYLTVRTQAGASYSALRQDFMARHMLAGRFVQMDILSGIAGIFCFRAHIPADMIPTRWSDFSFWRSWRESEREALLLLLLTEKQKPMQPYVENFYRALACGILFWIFAAAFLKSLFCLHFPGRCCYNAKEKNKI